MAIAMVGLLATVKVKYQLEQLQAERMQLAASANAPEGREGIAAFLDKRQPDFVAIAPNQPA